MIRRRLVVHIGIEKTGTTSIQYVLSENRDQLVKNNILYPRIFGKRNHTYLSSACLDDDVHDNIKANILASTNWTVSELRDRMEVGFREELESHENVRDILVSTELIHSRLIRPSEIKRLMDMFREYVDKIEIVVLIRRQDRVATSRINTALRSGSSEFDEVFQNFSPQQYFHIPAGKEPNDFIDYYDYRKLIERFTPHVGMENIKVGLYEDSPVSVVEKFLKLASINPDGLLASDVRLNKTMGVEAQFLISELNKSIPTVLKSGLRNQEYQLFKRSIEASYVGKARLFAENDARQFLEKFTDSNKWVRKHFFADRKELFDSNFSQYVAEADYEDLKKRLLPVVPKLASQYRAQTEKGSTLLQVPNKVMSSIIKMTTSPKYIKRYRRYIRNILRIIKWKQTVYGHRIANKLTIVGQAVQPTFALCRILGNDHWPRHSETQAVDNLKKILREECEFENCTKFFVVNRIIDEAKERELIECLKDSNARHYVIPFNLDDYAECEYDYALFGGENFFDSDKLGKLTPSQQNSAAIFACRSKIAYAMNVNGARNYAINRGNGIADWTLPWDGSCALSQASFDAIQDSCRRMPSLPLRIIPMTRVVSNHTKIEEFQPNSLREEPQIAISRNCVANFDEDWPYGIRDKTEFLKRAGVPGPWNDWPQHPWFPPQRSSKNIEGQFDYVRGYSIRLASGKRKLDESVDNTPRFQARNAAILNTIRYLETSLSREIPAFLKLPDRPK